MAGEILACTLCTLHNLSFYLEHIYSEELFPRSVFRQAHDRLKQHDPSHADAIYVRVLALAVECGEDRICPTGCLIAG